MRQVSGSAVHGLEGAALRLDRLPGPRGFNLLSQLIPKPEGRRRAGERAVSQSHTAKKEKSRAREVRRELNKKTRGGGGGGEEEEEQSGEGEYLNAREEEEKTEFG